MEKEYSLEELEEWVKDNENLIINKFCIDKEPVITKNALFMAGSPGAGKTETARSVAKDKEKASFIHIEQDEIKKMLPGYTGVNAPFYQKPATRGLEKVLKYVFKKGYNFILDTTLSNDNTARQNINQAIKKGYNIEIHFVYQDPKSAWNFVKKREQEEGRVVPIEYFAKQFINSRKVVNDLKKDFGKKVELHIVIKTVDEKGVIQDPKYEDNKENIDSYLDKHGQKLYNSAEEILNLIN